MCFSCRQPRDVQAWWRRRWGTGTGWPASRPCVTLRRRPGNPSASHLSKYLLLPLCRLLIFHSVAQQRCSRCRMEAFQDALGFFCSASNESVPYQFSALTFFFLLLFSSPIITQQANTGVRFNGFWGSLPVCHLLNSLVIVFHMLPWKRSIQALSVSLYLRPATRHALSRSLPFLVCLRLHAAFFCLSEPWCGLVYAHKPELPAGTSWHHKANNVMYTEKLQEIQREQVGLEHQTMCPITSTLNLCQHESSRAVGGLLLVPW